jgi:hypothetical protein
MFRLILIGVLVGIVIALLLRRRNPPPPMVEEIHPIGSGDESKGALPPGDETRAGQRDSTGERRDI